MLKIVKEQLHSWWWPVPFKTPIFVIERSRVSLPVDFQVKENIKCPWCKKKLCSFFAFLKSFSVSITQWRLPGIFLVIFEREEGP